jgi:hypothetical protein
MKCRYERPFVRSTVHLYGVNIAVRGKKEEEEERQEGKPFSSRL